VGGERKQPGKIYRITYLLFTDLSEEWGRWRCEAGLQIIFGSFLGI
jgi:hypothetical protein